MLSVPEWGSCELLTTGSSPRTLNVCHYTKQYKLDFVQKLVLVCNSKALFVMVEALAIMALR